MKDPAFHDALTKFEADMLMSFTRYKFGVLLCLDGQTDENEMFSNSILRWVFFLSGFCILWIFFYFEQKIRRQNLRSF